VQKEIARNWKLLGKRSSESQALDKSLALRRILNVERMPRVAEQRRMNKRSQEVLGHGVVV
jgi:hypothetical protein